MSLDSPISLDAFWIPFTCNRAFKAAPRLLVSAEGMYYRSADGRRILDGVAGLWCVQRRATAVRDIVAAVQKQVAELDFAPTSRWGIRRRSRLADAVAKFAPAGLDHVFFANSGSEAVDTALKIALAYQRVRGAAARTRFIGRERGYHGVNFGGISVGGMSDQPQGFGAHAAGRRSPAPHRTTSQRNAFSRGQPEHGANLAASSRRLVALHDADRPSPP